MVEINFLGGASEVGKVAMLMRLKAQQLLFDYGMSPGKPPSYPIPAPPIEFTFLTHAHLDHSGMIPWLCRRYGTKVISTSVTTEVAEVLQKDSLKVAKAEGYSIPYSSQDISNALRNWVEIKPKSTYEIGDTKIIAHWAGHIPGALMFEVRNSSTMLFTGDIQTLDMHLLRGAKPVRCDTLFLEGTYAGREHRGRRQLEKEFIDQIEEVLARNGRAIIPAFGVGRSQEVALILKDKGFQVWGDGMGNSIAKIYLKNPAYITSAKELSRAFKQMKLVRSAKNRKRVLRDGVVITTSGMLDGGPVLWYLEEVKNDPRSAILLTGYQIPGTNGRQLLDHGTIDIKGVKEGINCEVKHFDFSAHAGHSELVKFAKACKPEKVVLFHSDNRRMLAEELKDFAEVYLPENKREFSL
jgi:putative mRNA 3-end processing factor